MYLSELTLSFLKLIRKSFFTSNDSFLKCGPTSTKISSLHSPFFKKKFNAFSIIPEKVPFHPAWIIPKYLLPKITIGAQSAVKTPRIKSFLFEITPSAFKVWSFGFSTKTILLE